MRNEVWWQCDRISKIACIDRDPSKWLTGRYRVLTWIGDRRNGDTIGRFKTFDEAYEAAREKLKEHGINIRDDRKTIHYDYHGN